NQDDEVMMRRNLSCLIATALMTVLLQPAFGADPPAAAITEKMAGVTDELNRKETGKPVQTEQKEIVNDLDKLIASLEKKCEACKNGVKRNNPRFGMRDSTISRGTGGIGDLVNPRDSGKDWAKLSHRERDRIVQSMTEGFPPEYRTVLERYYRRLAEEKTGPAAGAASESKPAEAPKAGGQ
ncbi:MAG TPA: hypothetical protein VFF52_08245, partial [Isosphaeraceae bacterium]|nr:hypothetical protein [Isosphaeraceae bacterium]